MRPSRRQALSLALVPLAAGCSDRGPVSGRGTSTTGSARRVATPLGDIEIVGTSDQSWLATVSSAAARVAGIWGRSASALRVTICATDEEFATASSGLDDITAAVTTPRGIFVGPSVLRTLTPPGRTMVLAHELTHARLGHHGADRTAWWVKEGAAEWTAAHGVGLSTRQLWPGLAELAPDQRPSNPPRGADAAGGTALAYETAAAYATYLVATWGQASFENLVRTRPSDATARQRAGRGTSRSTSFQAWLGQRLDS